MVRGAGDDDGMIVTVTTMQARDGTDGSLRDALAEVTSASRAEPGCVSYEVARNIEDPARFVIVAAWTSPEAVEAHIGFGHAAAFRAATAGVFAEPFSTVVLAPLGRAPAP
jgi:quinol monooxygenase YgiN